MTEQDFRDKFSSILSKAMKLEMEHPRDWGVATVVSIALGATVPSQLRKADKQRIV